MRVTAKTAIATGAAICSSLVIHPMIAVAHPVPDSSNQVTATPPPTYVVIPGDSLSGIAQLYSLSVEALAAYNKIANPNFILPGLTLQLPPPSYLPPPYHPSSVAHQTSVVRYSNQPSYSYSYSGLAACIIGIESKGNPYIYNSQGSGAWGLYQFMPATYAYYADKIGLGGTFGSASAAQQTEVFNYAISHGGRSNWQEC